MSNRIAYHKKNQNKLSMLLVCGVVVLLMTVVFIKSLELKDKIAGYDERIEKLTADIEEEKARSKQIEEYKVYTQTKAFYEEVAKDKLGLVYEGEIIFKQE